MDAEAITEVSVTLNDVKPVDPEVELSKVDLIVEMSSDGEQNAELGIVDKFLKRMKLDLACASEKLVNLNVLMMHIATKEHEFETITSPNRDSLGDSVEALEFDLLSRILDSELTELDKFMSTSQKYIVEIREIISSQEHLNETFMVMEEMLCDAEKSLEQLQDQISEIREQSAKFRKTVSCLNGEENWNANDGSISSEDGHFLSMNAKMQTAEQQRHILRMLEKSLAREMDTENKLTESRQIEEELKHRLHSTEQALYFSEEEAADMGERWFAAENVAEVLKGISQELLSRLQLLHFNLNSSNQRENELRTNLQKSIKELETKENILQKLNSGSAKLSDSLLSQIDNLKASLKEAEDKLILSDSEASTLREKLSSLEKQLEEVDHVKVVSEKVNSLEKQLRESDIHLQHAMASADASQEKQNMLFATIRDMENLIQDLKLKVSRAENRADSAEDKCIVLSESNAELNEELRFLRGKLECLEASLNQAEEAKMSSARDIGIQTKVIMDLVMQLAIERERLHKKMTSLALDNKTLVVKLQQTGKTPFVVANHVSRGNDEKEMFSEQEKSHNSAADSKSDKCKRHASAGKTEVEAANPILESGGVRRIDAGILNYKQIFMVIFILLLSAAVYLFEPQNHGLRQ